jgi:excisionase family DNA binding protein
MTPLTPAQAAARINRPLATVRRWILTGFLPVTRFGRAIMVDPATLDALPARKAGKKRRKR